ncbi:TPA: hypothetical protein KO426_002312 [Clostridioides difficile]|nr:hypothetical protein [Clostridioides difficile]HBF8970274.1 hypothetical protein [Clostridioides difficile]HBF9837212.1 hypothetical protein [Clostridioides difficile]HBG4547473.1 hypothetical protein [Clostridioides difficile]HBZ0367722.1 hypothetical protein [Clostridioides difficile]
MNEFLLSVLASLAASVIIYLISKLNKKVKSHSVQESSFSFELKVKFKKNNQ